MERFIGLIGIVAIFLIGVLNILLILGLTSIIIALNVKQNTFV